MGTGTIVAVMNAKGGVGKSTTTMMLAESITSQHRKSVLVIDTDPQANSSLMLLGPEKLEHVHHQDKTLPMLINRTTAGNASPTIRDYIVEGASDVSNAHNLHVLPGAVDLAWVERDMRDQGEKTPVVAVARMIRDLKREYDFILIDCPPSISFFTECWLRHSDLHLAPSKPELLSNVGLKLIRELRAKAAMQEQKLADDMGVLITMWQKRKNDELWEKRLRQDKYLSCFLTVIPQSTELQRAAEFVPVKRVFSEKYREHGATINKMSKEFLERISKLTG